MDRLSVGDQAPDFTLPNQKGEEVTLSDAYRAHNLLLVFNIGFV